MKSIYFAVNYTTMTHTFLKMSEMYFIYFICLILSQTDTYTVICTNLEMKCFSITFQKIILKPFKQGILMLAQGM